MLGKVLEREEMEMIFFDLENVPKKLLKNYYELVCQIIGRDNIKPNNVIYDNLIHSISSLGEEQKKFIFSRFGLEDGNFKNYDTIASLFNVQRDYVRTVMGYACDTLQTLKFRYYIPARIEFLQEEKLRISDEIKTLIEMSRPLKKVEVTIYDYGFSTRAVNCLRRNKIITRNQLMNLTPKKLLKIDGMGKQTVNEIWNKLYGEDLIK